VRQLPPVPPLRSGASIALSAKLPAVHPALPRNVAGQVFLSCGKLALVGQSGNLGQGTLVCQLMKVESTHLCDDV